MYNRFFLKEGVISTGNLAGISLSVVIVIISLRLHGYKNCIISSSIL